MKFIAKFIRILFMILGISMAAAITIMLILDHSFATDPNLIMPAWLVYTILIAVDIFCIFLFVYNIICLAKGIDVFFWLIFRRERYNNGEYKDTYKPASKPSSYKPSYSSSSYSTPKPAPKPTPKPSYEFGKYEIANTVKGTSRVQVGFSGAYVSVDDVYVKETGDYEFEVNIKFKVTGNATIKDNVDASRFKDALKNAQEYLFNRIDDNLHPKYVKYGFGYELKVTGCSTSDLKISTY